MPSPGHKLQHLINGVWSIWPSQLGGNEGLGADKLVVSVAGGQAQHTFSHTALCSKVLLQQPFPQTGKDAHWPYTGLCELSLPLKWRH